jgi:membrane-associated phospholipid phosphatase
MDLFIYRDYIGLYGPIILFIISVILLRNKKTYLIFFIYGFILNNILNIILKLFFREPRPLKDLKNIEIGIVNGYRIGYDKFGMPSGYAQNSGYCLLFITYVFNSPSITLLFMLISLITMFQRYIYNNHNSIFQLLIGFIIGGVVGYLIYLIGNKFMVGNIKSKMDENGPL